MKKPSSKKTQTKSKASPQTIFATLDAEIVTVAKLSSTSLERTAHSPTPLEEKDLTVLQNRIGDIMMGKEQLPNQNKTRYWLEVPGIRRIFISEESFHALQPFLTVLSRSIATAKQHYNEATSLKHLLVNLEGELLLSKCQLNDAQERENLSLRKESILKLLNFTRESLTTVISRLNTMSQNQIKLNYEGKIVEAQANGQKMIADKQEAEKLESYIAELTRDLAELENQEMTLNGGKGLAPIKTIQIAAWQEETFTVGK